VRSGRCGCDAGVGVALGRDLVEHVRGLGGVQEYSADVHGPSKRVDTLSWRRGGVSDRQLQVGMAVVSCKDVQGAGGLIKKQRREPSHGGLCATQENPEQVTKAFLVEVT
jgi:hypothetical protein